MKILMFRPSYYPEISGGTHLGMDLIADLIDAGHEVVLVTPAPWRVSEEIKLKYRNMKIEKQYNGKLVIHRVYVSANEKSLTSRAIRMLLLTLGMSFRALKEKKVDIIMSHSMPVFIGPISVLIKKLKRVPLLYLESDVVSESIISTGIAKEGLKKKLLYSLGKTLEKVSLKGSQYIITVSELFRRRNIDTGISKDKIEVIYNWIDTDKVVPIPRRDNILFDRFKLDRNKFFVTYCGNLGLPQNVEILVDAAKDLEHIKDLEFVIIGGGVRKEEIEQYIVDSNASNIKFFPLQPLEEVSYVYSLGDVGIVLGKKGTSKNGFPSKTWTMMATGQAIISCFDLDSELSASVIEGECGIAIEPDSGEKLKQAILEMYNNKQYTQKCGLNSRRYVNEKYSRIIATKKYINALEKVVTNKN
ncbi:glycosyltransferase WbuB [Peribacillus asahii]|uniref:Glycosyltransferase WbuB n=1 Tax=Peribacillus asahii TaxID=228899 RepID=A0A398BAT4_9BACI|nr:glycosyltransferase family 4 protein [Peribacillus asahii]RID84733.1 glycosyltransferase WbuB [Peribacillus asahii]